MIKFFARIRSRLSEPFGFSTVGARHPLRYSLAQLVAQIKFGLECSNRESVCPGGQILGCWYKQCREDQEELVAGRPAWSQEHAFGDPFSLSSAFDGSYWNEFGK